MRYTEIGTQRMIIISYNLRGTLQLQNIHDAGSDYQTKGLEFHRVLMTSFCEGLDEGGVLQEEYYAGLN